MDPQYFNLLMSILMALNSMQTEKVMRPIFKDVRLWSDDRYITHTSTWDANDPYINYTLNVLQELHDVDIHVEATITQKIQPLYYFSVNTTMNLCSILNYTSKSPLIALIAGFLKEYGQLLDNCPIVKGQYFVHKFWPPEDTTLATLPEVDFDIIIAAFNIDDVSKERTYIMRDQYTGEFLVQDVRNAKPGLLALLPRTTGR